MESQFFIKIKFKNAGVFQKRWKATGESMDKNDRVFNNKLVRSGKNIDILPDNSMRTKDKWLDVDIGTVHYSTVQNILKCMAGIRPRPRYRDTCIVDNGQFMNAAKSSLVKVDSLVVKNKNTGVKSYPTETQTVIKNVPNCWAKPIVTWDKIKVHIGEEEFIKFSNKVNELLGLDCINSKVEFVFEKLRVLDNEYVRSLKSGVSPFNALARSEEEGIARYSQHTFGAKSDVTFVKYISLVTKGISNISRLDGSIFVPVNEDELNLIKSGQGMATMYDGGLAFIESIISDEDIDRTMMSGFVKVMDNA